MAEREGALVQYLLRYMRGLAEPQHGSHTVILRRETTNNSFQILTVQRGRHTTIAHLKAECAREFRMSRADACRLILRCENDDAEFDDSATLGALGLSDVTVMRVSEGIRLLDARAMLL